MNERAKIHTKLSEEIAALRRRVQELEQSASERKQTEEALRESEERHRAILQTAMDGFWVVDAQGRLLEVNETYCRMSGYSKQELLAMRITDLETCETPTETSAHTRKVMARREDRFETCHRRKDGTTFDVEVSVQYQPLEGGRFVGFLRDITERKRAETEIRVISDIGRLISSTLDIDEVYDRFATETQRLIPFHSLTINLYNSQNNTMYAAYVAGLDIEGRRQGDILAPEGSLSEAVIRGRTGLRIQPAHIDGIVKKFPGLFPVFQAGMRSIMCVPLVSRDEVIAVLHFRSKEPNAYTDRDLRTAERIGAQIAGAIANAQMYYDLKKTENSLRESETRFRRIVETADEGIREMTDNDRTTFVNRKLIEMLGYSQEEMLNRPFTDFMFEEDHPDHSMRIKRRMDGLDEHHERKFRRKDGTICWTLVSATPLQNEAGEVTGSFAMFTDITNRKRAEEDILELLQMLEAVPSGIVIHDHDGNCLYANQRTFDLHGYSRDEFMALTLRRLTAPASAKLINARIQELFDRGEISFEVEHLKKNGTILPLFINVKKATWGGTPVLLSTQTDFTERKRSEEELEKYRKHLEEMVQDRTAELEIKNVTLQELNSTLKVLLKQREDDKKDMEERFVMNVRNLVLPFVAQLKNGRLDGGQQPLLDIIETQLHTIATPLLKNIRQFNFTPRELKVALLVKEGKSTKEISEILNIAAGSIDIHRKNIRKKLVLRNRNANLQLHLQTLDQ